MVVATIVIATLASIGWSLWIRRATWTCRWETAGSLNIALQGAAVILMSPVDHRFANHYLHALTSENNLSQYIAHDCYVVAASAVVYSSLGRLDDAHHFQWAFRQYVERPATLCIPFMLAAFSLGNGARIYNSDFFNVPCDGWLTTYWLLFCGMTIYLLAYGVRALNILRADPRSRAMATVYLTAAWFGIVACSIRIYACFNYRWELKYGDDLTWFTACACGALFAAASGHSWLQKTRWFTKPTLETTS